MPNPRIQINSNIIDCCNGFCYLGSMLSNDLSVDRELQSRVSKASAAFGCLENRVWRSHHLKIGTKIQVYKSMVLSVLLYGCETWTVHRRHIRYLDRFHQRCVRQLLGIQWSDRVPNTAVLRRAGLDGIEAMLMLHQLRWLGHVRRMGDERIPKQLLYGQLKAGKRNVGRPRLRYQDCVRASLSSCGVDHRTWENIAVDRTVWRNTVRSGVRTFEEQRLGEAEYKRAIRKGIIVAVDRAVGTAWPCDICGR